MQSKLVHKQEQSPKVSYFPISMKRLLYFINFSKASQNSGKG